MKEEIGKKNVCGIEDVAFLRPVNLRFVFNFINTKTMRQQACAELFQLSC